MGRIRRKFTAEFKQQIVQEILSGQTTQSAAAREHQLGQSVIRLWMAASKEGTPFIDRPSVRERKLESECQRLKAKVGELVMQIDLLKKFDEYVRQSKRDDSSVVTFKNLARLKGDAK